MNNDFARILTLLRKERGLSQKEASVALGVSQALLSHYENGKRECGLDFLCTTADFYDVSCDYLLGRTTERRGAVITITEAATAAASGDGDVSTDLLLEKRIVMNSITLLYDLMLQVSGKGITEDCSKILMLAVYRVIRILHTTDKANSKSMFTVPSFNYCALASGKSSLCEANAINNARKLRGDSEGSVAVTPERLSEKYPLYAPAALNLIQMVENDIRSNSNEK